MKALSDGLWEKLQKKIDALKVKIWKEKQLELNMQLKNYGEN